MTLPALSQVISTKIACSKSHTCYTSLWMARYLHIDDDIKLVVESTRRRRRSAEDCEGK